jgi:hypothetical protein
MQTDSWITLYLSACLNGCLQTIELYYFIVPSEHAPHHSLQDSSNREFFYYRNPYLRLGTIPLVITHNFLV